MGSDAIAEISSTKERKFQILSGTAAKSRRARGRRCPKLPEGAVETGKGKATAAERRRVSVGPAESIGLRKPGTRQETAGPGKEPPPAAGHPSANLRCSRCPAARPFRRQNPGLPSDTQ